MKILFEINHPGHIHLFHNLAMELKKKNIDSLFLIKSEEVIEKLAGHYNLPVIRIGKKGKGLYQKYLWQFFFLLKTIWIVRKNKVTMGIGVSMNLPLVSKFSKMKSIGCDDDDMAVTPVFAKYANKASAILTPSALSHEQRGSNHITYAGYHELAYLHPNRFQPDVTALKVLGVGQGESYFMLRFNSFSAHHDIGHKGMSFEQKKELIKELKSKGRIFISTESEIDPEFAEFKLPDRPELMHSFLAFAKMYVGESQTITSEATVLGVPALKCNTFAHRLSIPNELEERYGLCYSFLPEEFGKMLEKIDELLAMPDLKSEWQKRRQKMLKDKIDVTAFLVWFVENYPESASIMKTNPDYQYRFR
jgi:predicted glycosyltransferase